MGVKVTDDSEAGKSQVLKWTCFAHSVQKRVKEKRDVSSKEGWPGQEVKKYIHSKYQM